MRGVVYIYGMFDKRGACVYVGQTCNTTARQHSNRNTLNNRDLELRVLYTAKSRETARKKEEQAIAEMLRAGEKLRNKRTRIALVNPKAVRFRVGKRVLIGVGALADYLGCCDSTISNHRKLMRGDYFYSFKHHKDFAKCKTVKVKQIAAKKRPTP